MENNQNYTDLNTPGVAQPQDNQLNQGYAQPVPQPYMDPQVPQAQAQPQPYMAPQVPQPQAQPQPYMTPQVNPVQPQPYMGQPVPQPQVQPQPYVTQPVPQPYITQPMAPGYAPQPGIYVAPNPVIMPTLYDAQKVAQLQNLLCCPRIWSIVAVVLYFLSLPMTISVSSGSNDIYYDDYNRRSSIPDGFLTFANFVGFIGSIINCVLIHLSIRRCSYAHYKMAMIASIIGAVIGLVLNLNFITFLTLLCNKTAFQNAVATVNTNNLAQPIVQ